MQSDVTNVRVEMPEKIRMLKADQGCRKGINRGGLMEMAKPQSTSRWQSALLINTCHLHENR